MMLVDLKDSTQERILPHLSITEQFICSVGKRLSGHNVDCVITAMEDLGLSHNIMRMRGGFYTGIFVRWNCDGPFIPVDSTVNSCGVSVYAVNGKMSYHDFKSRIENAEKELTLEGMKCNFNIGNHFISFCFDEATEQHYLLIHASDNTYKFGEKGLYPREDTWYYKKIRVETNGDRYLRYIDGRDAETFFYHYKESEKSNPIRNDRIADAILKGIKFQEVLYTQHYGMPDISSLAIGCQWQGNKLVLLTSEGKDIFIIEEKTPRKVTAFPHGFGVKVNGICWDINYTSNNFQINSINFPNNDDTFWKLFTKTRNSDKVVDEQFVRYFLRTRNIHIKAQLHQLYSYSITGFHSFKEGALQ